MDMEFLLFFSLKAFAFDLLSKGQWLRSTDVIKLKMRHSWRIVSYVVTRNLLSTTGN